MRPLSIPLAVSAAYDEDVRTSPTPAGYTSTGRAHGAPLDRYTGLAVVPSDAGRHVLHETKRFAHYGGLAPQGARR